MVRMVNNERLEWQQAQKAIAKLLRINGFEVWEERKVEGKRIDVLSKRIINNKTYYLVFEVKHYKNVRPSTETKFEDQLISYLEALIRRELNNKSIKTLLEKYVFIGYLVMTKDYMLLKNRKINYHKPRNPFQHPEIKKLWRRNVYLLYSTPEYIRKNLEKIGLRSYKQTHLIDFLND